jgi:hypothetical protein
MPFKQDPPAAQMASAMITTLPKVVFAIYKYARKAQSLAMMA